MIRGIGTIIDVVVILITGSVGLFVGNKLQSSSKKMLTTILGLIAMVTGIKMVIEGDQLFIVLISLCVGVLIGEKVKLDQKIEAIPHNGFITATLLSLVGPMAIVGPIREGLGKGFELLLIKAGFDGISTLLLASMLGIGVILSALPVLLFQGAMTFIASIFGGFISDSFLQGLMSIGGILILAVGLDLLSIKKNTGDNHVAIIVCISAALSYWNSIEIYRSVVKWNHRNLQNSYFPFEPGRTCLR
jgi:uncharacterized protein